MNIAGIGASTIDSLNGMVPFLFALFATLGVVPIFREAVKGLTGAAGSRLRPVLKVARHGGVALFSGIALALFWVPVTGHHMAALGLASALVLLAAVIRYTPVWQGRSRITRAILELLLLWGLIYFILVPDIFGTDVQRPLILLIAIGVLFIASFCRLGLRADRTDPLLTGYIAMVIMLSILTMTMVRPDVASADTSFLNQIQEGVQAGQGALLACFFYAIKTSWRSNPSLRMGPDGHVLLGLFVVWSGLLMLAHFGNWATMAAALCWLMAAPVFWALHNYLTGISHRRVARHKNGSFPTFIVLMTAITCAVGIAVAAFGVSWKPALAGLLPAFVIYWLLARYMLAIKANDAAPDGPKWSNPLAGASHSAKHTR